jgi:hypothetical protein
VLSDVQDIIAGAYCDHHDFIDEIVGDLKLPERVHQVLGDCIEMRGLKVHMHMGVSQALPVVLQRCTERIRKKCFQLAGLPPDIDMPEEMIDA